MPSRLTCAALLVLSLAVSSADAQPPSAALVVVVESSDPAVRPQAFREALARTLGVPVRALGASADERSVVMVHVPADAAAQVRIERPGERPRRMAIPRGRGDWLVEGVIQAMRGASLVTWEGQTRTTTGPPLADWEEPAEVDRSERDVESGTALDPPPR